MINILIPLAGESLFFNKDVYPYPKPFIEIKGKSMIEHVIDNFKSISQPKRFIFIVKTEDCHKYNLHGVLHLLTDGNCDVIQLDKQTKGAACSCLFSIDFINNEDALIIANADQLFDFPLEVPIQNFLIQAVDAGVLTFESINPRWSFVKTDEKGFITETAEKMPISKQAIAGFYFFKQGKEFVQAAMNSILKERAVNDQFHIAPTLNELILENKTLKSFPISNTQYHTFYSPQKIEEYENR